VLLLALGHLGHFASQKGHVVEGLHESNRTADTSPGERAATVRSK
jgi:hypothetical protein